ncbi:unnamed protein product [Tuber aestivum]|uniref:NACHT domain-containing protein n=1 Tax=Tuber aestivum TaxID=59557 RepID=A0A292Q7R1_9PEZI|nr:unnamed protein product [Tuber aestivum]
MPPDRCLSNAAVEYIETRVDGQLHSAFEDPNTGIRYNPTIDQFLDQKRLELQQQRQQQELQASIQQYSPFPSPPSPCRADKMPGNSPTYIDKLVKEREERFQEALDAYLKTPSAERTPSKLVGNTTWDDVQKLMRKAEDEYHDVGTIRKHLRKFSENAPIFNSWLTLLPQASYSSTIYGGFRIMFDAAAKLHDVREKVFEILGEIPDRIAKTQVYAELYRSSQQVQERSAELYVAILDIFEHVLGWFAKKPGRKFGKALLKGELYSKEIDLKVSKMRDVAKNLREEAKLCLHESLREMKNGSVLQDSRLQNMESMNHEILRNSLNANFTTQMQNQMLTEIYNKVYQLLQSSANYDKDTGQANVPQIESDARGRRTNKVYSIELLSSLSFSPGDLATAVKTSLRHGHGASLAEKDRANWIMKSQRMSQWLTSTTPSTLLINGNGEHKKISPLSFIAALLVQSLTQSDVPVLYFFCGENTSSSGGGPSDLIRSLTAQLLTHYDFDLTTLRHTRKGTPKTTKQLCTLFEGLLAQLPDDSLLFILIDGITYFENADRREETCFIIERLHEISQGAHPLVKVLVTAPSKSRYVVKVLQSDGGSDDDGKAGGMNEGSGWGVLHAPVNPGGGRVGLSVPYWERRTTGSVTDLRRAAEEQSDGIVREEEDGGRKGRKGKGRRRARSEEGRTRGRTR